MDLRHLALKSSDTGLGRRAFVAGVAGALVHAAVPAFAHNSAGAVTPPQRPPEVALTFDDEQASTLTAALAGHVSALQLMFTSCQATCPIQGALFAESARKLGDQAKSAQLLSISIDPGHDTPAALREWLKRFGPSPLWRAARPNKDQLDPLVAFLKSKTSGPDPHTAQAYFFNRQGALVLRSVDFPPAADIVRVLTQLSKLP